MIEQEKPPQYLYSVWVVWETPRNKGSKQDMVEAATVQEAIEMVVGPDVKGLIIVDARRVAPSSYVAICKRQEGSRYDYTGVKDHD